MKSVRIQLRPRPHVPKSEKQNKLIQKQRPIFLLDGLDL